MKLHVFVALMFVFCGLLLASKSSKPGELKEETGFERFERELRELLAHGNLPPAGGEPLRHVRRIPPRAGEPASRLVVRKPVN